MLSKEEGIMIVLSSPSGAGKTTISKLFFFESRLTRVVFPAPDGEDKIIIIPSFLVGI